jgi:aerobic carbon-monoxide dehydrogenase large subunit
MSGDWKGRREDFRLLTGQGRYAADWNLPGQLYACFLRSDRAHAEIVSIDTRAAGAAPGVVAVLTGADTAGFRSPVPWLNIPGRGGKKLQVPHRPMLAQDRVRHVGEAVAAVIAESPHAAQDAVELIETEYRDLPAVIGAERAIAGGAPRVHADIADNICFDYDYGSDAETQGTMARAAHVTRLRIDSNRVVANPMEPRACMAAYDGASNSYDVYVCTQGGSAMRSGLAAITGIAPEKIRVHAQDVGGGFGVRTPPYPEYCVLLLAAGRLGRPVKWVGTRSEVFSTDHHGRAVIISGELALDREGRFLAARYHWLCDQGAYLSAAGPSINTQNGVFGASGAYRIPVIYGRHQLIMTNTTPTGPYRGAGRPDIAYIVERLVEQAAAEMKIDRLELRRRNFIPPEAFPYKTATGITYDSADFAGMLDEVLKRSDWNGFAGRRAQSERRGKLRGISCGVFIEPSGGGLAPKDQVSIRFGSNGDMAIYTVSQSQGQGHETVFPELVASELGIDPGRVTLRASDPVGSAGLIGNGSFGSRSLISHGSAIKLAAVEVVRRGMALAAKEFEAAPQDIEFRDGVFGVAGTDRRIGVLDLARKYAAESPHPLDADGEQPVERTFPSGAHVAEVEIDPDTGESRLCSYAAVDDFGRVINHTIVDGQLHGAVAQGAGQVFGEDCVFDPESGQLFTGTFMDYTMPRADTLPNIQGYDRSVPSPNNPLGAKGAGEAGTTGALPTLMNAIVDALRPLGIDHLDMPASPNRLWQTIQEARGSKR